MHISTCFLSNCTLTCHQLTIRNITPHSIYGKRSSTSIPSLTAMETITSTITKVVYIKNRGNPRTDDVTSRVRVPGPHAVVHRVHHHDLMGMTEMSVCYKTRKRDKGRPRCGAPLRPEKRSLMSASARMVRTHDSPRPTPPECAPPREFLPASRARVCSSLTTSSSASGTRRYFI